MNAEEDKGAAVGNLWATCEWKDSANRSAAFRVPDMMIKHAHIKKAAQKSMPPYWTPWTIKCKKK